MSKVVLLASSGTKAGIIKLITRYFWGSSGVNLRQKSDGVYDVHTDKGHKDTVRVILKKKRYRFEMGIFFM